MQGGEHDTVTVIGFNFAKSAEVLFDYAPAKATTFVSSNELRATVPAGDGTVPVTVRNPDGQESTQEGGFSILPQPASFLSLTPSTGPSEGGTSVILFGDRLSDVTSVLVGNRVVIGLNVVDDGQITFTTPPHAAGTVDVRLIDSHSRAVTATGVFTYLSTYRDSSTARMPTAVSGGRFSGGIAMALGDLDGDGDSDLLVVNDADPVVMLYYGTQEAYGYYHPGLRVFLNDGSGDFKSEKSLDPPVYITETWQARAMALGDVDGDSDLDLVLATGFAVYGGNIYTYYSNGQYYDFYDTLYPSTRVMLNDGLGGFDVSLDALPDPNATDGVDILNATAVALGDLDDDGDLDLVVTHRWSAYTSYSYDFYSTYLGKQVYLTLFDGYDYSTAATRILLNDGDGQFTDVTDTALPNVDQGDLFAADAVAIGDVDRDGNADIVITSDRAAYDASYQAYVSGSKTRILKGDGKGNFTNVTASRFPAKKATDEWGGRTLALGDLDDDGWTDIVLGTGRYLQLLLNPYTYEYRYFSSTRIFKGGTFKATKVAVGDLDGDDDLDVVLAFYAGVYTRNPLSGDYEDPISSVRWLRNVGTGVLENVSSTELPNPALGSDFFIADDLVLGDVDGDSDVDILFTANPYTMYYFCASTHATRQFDKR